MSVKTKLIIFILSALLVLLVIIASIIAFILWTYDAQTISKNKIDELYDNHFCLGLITDDHILYLNFNLKNATNIFCIKKSEIENSSTLLDNFTVNSRETFDQNVKRTIKLDNDAIEEIINTLGGVKIQSIDGNEEFLLGQDFINIILNSTDNQYVAYLYGTLFQNIFTYKKFDYLYENSDLSFADITAYSEEFENSLQQINCIDSGG